MDSIETEDNATNLYEELKIFLKLCRMKPHKCLSDSRKVLGRISIEERAKKSLHPTINKDTWNSLNGRRGYIHILAQQCL